MLQHEFMHVVVERYTKLFADLLLLTLLIMLIVVDYRLLHQFHDSNNVDGLESNFVIFTLNMKTLSTNTQPKF